MDTRSGTAAGCALERNGTADEISSPQPTACSGLRENSRFGIAAACVEETILARRNPQPAALLLRGGAGSSGPPRFRTQCALSRAMVAHRVAPRRSRTHQVLALHTPGRDPTQGLSAHGQTALDHRAG